MSFPKVSVIVVNWNNFADTAECLESLRKATYPNYEVVLVDNGSVGDDVERLKEGFGDYVRLIPNERNCGFGEGCNIGISDALARGADYVALLNNDTVVAPDFLEDLVDVAGGDGRVGICGGKIYCHEIPDMIWSAGGYINFWTGNTPVRGSGETDRGQYDGVAEVDWICGCFMFVSRDVLESVGMLDKRFFFGWEDADLCVRAARKGFKVLYVPGSRIWHKTLPPEKQKRLMGPPVYYAARGRFIFMEKHLTRPQLAVSAFLFVVRFPKFASDYSRILGERKVPLYIAWGVLGYLKRRFQSLLRIR